MLQGRVPAPRFANPASAGAVVRGVRAAQILGKGTDQALNRRLKLSDALSKFKAATSIG